MPPPSAREEVDIRRKGALRMGPVKSIGFKLLIFPLSAQHSPIDWLFGYGLLAMAGGGEKPFFNIQKHRLQHAAV